jgi:hypothetical protein
MGESFSLEIAVNGWEVSVIFDFEVFSLSVENGEFKAVVSLNNLEFYFLLMHLSQLSFEFLHDREELYNEYYSRDSLHQLQCFQFQGLGMPQFFYIEKEQHSRLLKPF